MIDGLSPDAHRAFQKIASEMGVPKPRLRINRDGAIIPIKEPESAAPESAVSSNDPQDSEAAQASTTRSARARLAFSRKRFRSPDASQAQPQRPSDSRSDSEPPWKYERDRALRSLDEEKNKQTNRIRVEQLTRVHRMRSSKDRIREKGFETNDEVISSHERLRRISLLLRFGMYDRIRMDRILRSEEDIVTKNETTNTGEVTVITARKSDLLAWFDALLPHEQQRLYVIGRKRFDFKFNTSAFLADYFERYPELRIKDDDLEDEKKRKQGSINAAVHAEQVFQKEQKELADALEVVAVPMLRAIFKAMGKKADIYLTSSNDDIAGGLDVAIDLKLDTDEPARYPDGRPMRFVVDMTYARMRDKADKDLARGRISEEAYSILKDRDDKIPPQLANARAMKLFRTVVETIGGPMSTQTFDQNGPLAVPQEHVPRLIIGLDWDNAFSAISNWVAHEDFEDTFSNQGLARRITLTIRNQLFGLRAVAERQNAANPNIPYLDALIAALGFKTGRLHERAMGDRSLGNIEQLITRDTLAPRKWVYHRFYHAVLAQVEHDARIGRRVRGDMGSATVQPVFGQPEVATSPDEGSQNEVVPAITASADESGVPQSDIESVRLKKIAEIDAELERVARRRRIRDLQAEIAKLKSRSSEEDV